MKTLANVLFTLLMLTFGVGFAVAFFLRVVGPSRIAELDRAGAINEEVIKRAFPEYIDNLRYTLGRDITSLHEKVLWLFLILGLASSVMGFCCTFERKKSEK